MENAYRRTTQSCNYAADLTVNLNDYTIDKIQGKEIKIMVSDQDVKDAVADAEDTNSSATAGDDQDDSDSEK